jgi:hypothetical protein
MLDAWLLMVKTEYTLLTVLTMYIKASLLKTGY